MVCTTPAAQARSHRWKIASRSASGSPRSRSASPAVKEAVQVAMAEMRAAARPREGMGIRGRAGRRAMGSGA